MMEDGGYNGAVVVGRIGVAVGGGGAVGSVGVAVGGVGVEFEVQPISQPSSGGWV